MSSARTLRLVLLTAVACGSSPDAVGPPVPVTPGMAAPAREVVDSGSLGGPAAQPGMQPMPGVVPAGTPDGGQSTPAMDAASVRPPDAPVPPPMDALPRPMDMGATTMPPGDGGGCSATTPKPPTCDPIKQDCGSAGL